MLVRLQSSAGPTLFPYTTLCRSAGIQSATSRQNTKDQVYAQNEMLAYQQKESTARVDKQASHRSEERFSRNAETDLVCRLLLEKKNKTLTTSHTQQHRSPRSNRRAHHRAAET